MYALTNCTIFTGKKFLKKKSVIINGNKIDSIISNRELPSTIKTIDLKKRTIAPGFIDIQVNGGGGVLFNDKPSILTIKKIVKAHQSFGTTNILPTFITDSSDKMLMAASAVNEYLESNMLGILGIHFEGPFLSQKKVGAHNIEFIRDFNDTDARIICSLKRGITLLTAAPEKLEYDSISFFKKTNSPVQILFSDLSDVMTGLFVSTIPSSRINDPVPEAIGSKFLSKQKIITTELAVCLYIVALSRAIQGIEKMSIVDAIKPLFIIFNLVPFYYSLR